ncbi:MAG: ABC transporter permease [Chloroflexaceae bacterium]|nr:ABC transporter permease [Chloroflexaceae bacterium]NJO07038.1 ABC transporter permease [Chloroflexaceae bacterium]
MLRQIQPGVGRMLALTYALPMVTFILVIALWEAMVVGFGIPLYLLPAPSAIWEVFASQPAFLFRIGMTTFSQALSGFVIGCTLGILVAAICVRWRVLARGLVPFSVASNAVPIVALSPLFGIWLGSTSPASKIAVVAVMTFFPTLVNVFRGLTSPTPDAIQLLRSYAAPEHVIFFKLRLPASLPYLFNALKISATLSMIGAVVAEFFGGLRNSLGVYIKSEAGILHTREAWSAIVVASIIGITFYTIIVIAERFVMPWYTARQR